MKWEELIGDQGQFRKARFFAENHRLSGGRRRAVHEYPGRDEIWPEDLGRKPRGFTVKAYCIGDDYIADRDALIEALDKEGDGVLRHPWLGNLNVAVEDWDVQESIDRQGMAEFTIRFLPAGSNRFPQGTTDTRQKVTDAADATVGTCEAAFEDEFSINDAPGWSVDTITDRINELGSQIRDKTGDLADLISAPGDLASGITSAISSLYQDLGYGLSTIQRALDFGADWPALPFTTPLRQQQARNQYQLKSLARVAGIAEGARQLAGADLGNQQDAFDALDEINRVIDIISEETQPDGSPINDSIYASLADLRAAVNEDLRERGLRLPEVYSWTPPSTMPALLIAHQVYGDALRDQEIVDRNGIRHPGFVPGGEPLEVLRDV